MTRGPIRRFVDSADDKESRLIWLLKSGTKQAVKDLRKPH
jgi:hypothetical protein